MNKLLFFLYNFFIGQFKFYVTDELNTPEQITTALKEILPKIVNFKDILGQAGEKFKATDENVTAIKDITERLKTLEGNIDQIGNKVLDLGKKQLVIYGEGQNTNLTREAKLDFCKWVIAAHRMESKPSEKWANIMQEVYDKYSTDSYKAQCKKYGVEKADDLVEGTDSLGGYAVPELFIAEIMRVADSSSVVLQRAREWPITRGYKLPIIDLATNVSVAWTDESTAFTESNPTFGKTTTDAKKLGAYILMSNELLEDEEIGLFNLLVSLFGEAMAAEIDKQAFQGSGSPFTGVLNTVGVNAVVMATGDTSFADLSYDHFIDMEAAIKASVIPGSGYYMHRTILAIAKKIKDTVGNYIWQPPAADQPATINGWPYVVAEQMPNSSDDAVSTPFIFFGNLKNYAYGSKGPMTIQTSKELKIIEDQTVMVVRRRLALVATLPAAFSILKTAAS